MAPDLTALLGRGNVPQQPRWHRLTLHEGRESPAEITPPPWGSGFTEALAEPGWFPAFFPSLDNQFNAGAEN